jgi:hypothetical protein
VTALYSWEIASRTRSAAPPTSSGARVYSTTFDLTENPLSEGGAWGQAGSSWTVVQSGSGIAYGTQVSNAEPFDDSYSFVGGSWPADQEAELTIFKGTPTGNQEVECWLRGTTNGTTSTTGYEINYHHAGSYCEIVKWNGALGSFVYLAQLTVGLSAAVTGDKLKAVIVGDVIYVYFNGALLQSKDINTDKDGNAIGKYTTGNPGIGFFRNDTGTAANDQFGATAFTARGL